MSQFQRPFNQPSQPSQQSSYMQPEMYQQPVPRPSDAVPPSPAPQQKPPMRSVPPPKKSSRRNLWITIGVVTILVIVIATATQGKSSNTTSTTQATQAATQPQSQPTATPTQVPQPTATPTQVPTAKPAPSYPQFGDGTYQVGKDIQPGTYRTRDASSGCYYARLKGFGGTVDDIIANNNTDAPAIVSIAATDKGFTSENCGTWTKDLAPITTSKTTFGDGMYIIGTDITPGTYRNTGAQGCYFARLSGFGNTTDDIIANNNVDTATIVTVAPSDKGFQSNGCGTWTKQ